MKHPFMILLTLLSSIGFAQPNRDNDYLDDVVEEMARQYLQSKTIAMAESRIEKMAAAYTGVKLDGRIGQAFNLYDLYQNEESYRLADNDVQKYQALTHAAADAASIAFPPAGAAAEMIVLSQDLSAAYIFSAGEIDLAKKRSNVLHLEMERSRLKTRSALAEQESQKPWFARFASLTVLLKTYSKKVMIACNERDVTAIKPLDDCLNVSRQLVETVRAAIVAGNVILELPFSTNVGAAETLKAKLSLEINKLSETLKDYERRLDELFDDYLNQRDLLIRQSVTRSLLVEECNIRLATALENLRIALAHRRENKSREDVVVTNGIFREVWVHGCEAVQKELDPVILQSLRKRGDR